MPLSLKCSNSAYAYLLFRMATLRPQFSPVCQTAKLTCCTVLVARRKGVVSAAVIRALDGDMNGRLLARHDVKGDNEENRRIGEQELARCKAMGIEAGKVLRLGDMARSDNVIFSATGITKGDLLEGISRKGNIATTETLLIRGKSRTIRRIQSIHYLDRKDPEMQVHIL